ncbi:Clp protease N-terminal domain-containing protein [Acidimicrobiia bacterium EGI L10123]|uniref:Clp protease N-terminal domain-containing protein n=1 Tax=Salinilacustrithrix flava TaxID=2957203 RepID=UPI003D7C215B|nr:Clp protease N-terminal domain-containing protein [Acidimicrobiia bacterium EGI L10123]
MKTIAALLTQAEQIARARGTEQPAAEHLVLAALQLPDGTAAGALERLGSSAADFGAALDAQEVEDLERIGVRPDDDRISAELPPPGEPVGIYRSDPSAQELFQAAGDDARREGGALVGAHVLRAAADLEHGPTARALRRLGIDRTELRSAATAEIEARAGG